MAWHEGVEWLDGECVVRSPKEGVSPAECVGAQMDNGCREASDLCRFNLHQNLFGNYFFPL